MNEEKMATVKETNSLTKRDKWTVVPEVDNSVYSKWASLTVEQKKQFREQQFTNIAVILSTTSRMPKKQPEGKPISDIAALIQESNAEANETYEPELNYKSKQPLEQQLAWALYHELQRDTYGSTVRRIDRHHKRFIHPRRRERIIGMAEAQPKSKRQKCHQRKTTHKINGVTTVITSHTTEELSACVPTKSYHRMVNAKSTTRHIIIGCDVKTHLPITRRVAQEEITITAQKKTVWVESRKAKVSKQRIAKAESQQRWQPPVKPPKRTWFNMVRTLKV